MRAFVTGASGFLGRHLCRALVDRGDFVVGLVRDRVGGDPYASAIVHGDLSLPFLSRVVAEYEINTVFHLAAQVQCSVAKDDPVGTWEANARGTWNVLEACRRDGRNIRVVVASSDKAYGSGPAPYREDQPLLAHGVYATSKAAADLIAQSYAREYGMSVAITRCGNIYGPGNFNRSTLIGGTILSVLDGKRPVIRSDGSPRRDYLYVADAVAGYLALARSDFVGPMNFGTSSPVPARDVVGRIIRIMDADVEPVILGGAQDEIRDQWLDCSLARRVLGWEARTDLDAGLAQTVAWYRHRERRHG